MKFSLADSPSGFEGFRRSDNYLRPHLHGVAGTANIP